ncbi:hypothetical protein [Spiroplasma taiwanense]|uniref:Uncharacterized protein n=1 Tax=Spiroplasma taiwanense CT-1 TaxID=1276220 RepID=S5LY01_9MOLU|nr:hypothetical protein [Spiroplasma taiwanense]AGR41481.1 hypothetical protein STAIW_v1c08950 [Spiroplasma taiwanense CT-1]
MKNLDYLINKYSKKILKVKYNSINFYWEFINFTDIVNTNNFIKMFKKALNTEYNKKQEDDIKEKIHELRNIINYYLNKIKNLDFFEYKITILDNLLSSIYNSIKKFINNIIVTYLFFEKIHESIFENEKYFDNDLFYEWKLEILKFELIKHNLILLKSLNYNKKFEKNIIQEQKNIENSKIKISECYIKAII